MIKVLRDKNCRPEQGWIIFRRKCPNGHVESEHEICLSTGGEVVRELKNGWVVLLVDEGWLGFVHQSSLKEYLDH